MPFMFSNLTRVIATYIVTYEHVYIHMFIYVYIYIEFVFTSCEYQV